MNLHRSLFVAGVVSALLYAFLGPALPIRGGGEMIAIGQNLARTGVFGFPFVETFDTGPTAVVPPLYPAYAGMLIKLLGNSMAWIVLAAGVILLQGLHASLLPRLSILFYGDPNPGICAAILCILLPVYSWMPYWDTMYTTTGLALFCLASQGWVARDWPRLRLGALCGLCCGVLALANPASVLVVIPWLLFLLVGKRQSPRQTAGFWGCFAAASLLVVLPWCLRNYHQFGSLTLRTNLGMTLFASNNDCASSALVSELRSGCYAAHHPYGSRAEAGLLRSMGEPAYDRYRVSSAIDWARGHAGSFFHLTAKRIVEFWFPSPVYGVYGRSIWLVTALSIPGLFLMRRSLRMRFMGTVFLVYPCLYYVVVSDYRYRYPILWLSLLPAGYAISLALRRVRLPKRENHG